MAWNGGQRPVEGTLENEKSDCSKRAVKKLTSSMTGDKASCKQL